MGSLGPKTTGETRATRTRKLLLGWKRQEDLSHSRRPAAFGLGAGSEGWLEVKDDAATGYSHLGWPRFEWNAYNSANGETHPALDR